MKQFVIIFIGIFAVASGLGFAEAYITRVDSARATPVPQESIQALYQTISKLVQGVLDGDKFILSLLRLPDHLSLSGDQVYDLKKLLMILKSFSKDR